MTSRPEPGGTEPGPDGESCRRSAADAREDTGPALATTVVGIGASAGGLDALQALVRALPPDTGFAFVVVQHLDAQHPSLLTEILARATAMPVREVTDGTPPARDHVFVMPGHADVELCGSTLHLVPRPAAPTAHLPIDRLLRSLAAACGNQAIAVILSGNGEDGARGCESIKADGGLSFAQAPSTALFAGMPLAAIATGTVDRVLPPGEIAAELARLSRNPYLRATSAAADDAPAFAAVLAALRTATGIDFSCYRATTVRRRIARRIALRGFDTCARYAASLAADPAELRILERDLLIGVTQFFRDPPSFAALRQHVFPELLRQRTADEPLRIWVPGCATGEEAYSLTIALREHMRAVGADVPLQVYGSDINAAAVATARTGLYPSSIAADVAPELLARWFQRVDGGYRIDNGIRELCLFTRHNLLADPPFPRLDLISCRNVLMYLPGMQHSIVRLFHFALQPNGFLMVGAGENAAIDDLFTPLDGTTGIHRKHATTRRLPPLLAATRNRQTVAALPATDRAASATVRDSEDLRRRIDRMLLTRFSPAAVVVDEQLEVLEIRGRAAPYLALPEGQLSFNLIKLIPETGLYLAVERLLREARGSGRTARQHRAVYSEGERLREVDIEVTPLQGHDRRLWLVLFEPVATDRTTPAANAPAPPPDDATARQLAQLGDELAEARRRLLVLTEEHQASKDELQNVTEEALSANEELRSVNEELETAKEELQATNEELVAVNARLQDANAGLVRSRDQALSIVAAVQHPLLVLDRDLRVVSSNDAFDRAFQTHGSAITGLPLFGMQHGQWDLPELRRLLQAIAQDHAAPARVEVERDLPGSGHRSLLFGSAAIRGTELLLLTIEDLTSRRADEQALRQAEEHLRQTQKLEAVGRLAGGIAHDFNNLLTAIHGYSGQLLPAVAGNAPAIADVRAIQSNCVDAAALTRQLLAFGRRQVLQPKVLDLNALIADFEKLLRRLAGETIRYVHDAGPALWHVRADPGELGRVLMNLALNARDAMPDGGELRVQTRNVTVTADATTDTGAAVGDHVELAVHDNGVGMDRETLAHIFEPFFTTKELGKGTGLGLASVLGIVQQSGGVVRCQSQPGVGTTFRVLLPAVTAALDAPAAAPAMALPRSHAGEVVLLVEDDVSVRKLARRVLTDTGYTVIEAANGLDGLAAFESQRDAIQLLVTDVVMPGLGGRELAARARHLRPHLRVLFMSGHMDDAALKAAVGQGAAFLQKPYTPVEFAQMVRQVLDAPAPRSD